MVTAGDLHVNEKGGRERVAGKVVECGQRDKGTTKVPADETKSVGK